MSKLSEKKSKLAQRMNAFHKRDKSLDKSIHRSVEKHAIKEYKNKKGKGSLESIKNNKDMIDAGNEHNRS